MSFHSARMAGYGAVGGGDKSLAAARPFSMRKVALSIALCAGGMALLAMALVVTTQSRGDELLDKQQAAWWGYGHKDRRSGNWDQGWLHKYVHGASRGRGTRFQQGASQGGRAKEMEKIHALLDRAVGMLGNLGQRKGALQATAQQSQATKSYLDKTRQPQGPAELPQCFKLNSVDVGRITQQQRVSVAADHLSESYPEWTRGMSIPGKGQEGEWRHDRGPPYVQRLTMFAGEGVSSKGNGDLVRRVLGLKMAFGKSCDLRSCDHAWTGNSYLRSFDGSQFRFLYRNQCSVLVVPPLTHGPGPILGDNGLFRLHHFLKDGYNTLVVLGGTASILFLNQNVATLDGGFDLEPSWVDGPFEAQKPQSANTPFAALAATLPAPGISVTGVKISSLPANAVSYYEAEDTSVVFEIPMGTGRILYLGYDFSEPVTPWVHTLIAATMFNDYDFDGEPPALTAASVNRDQQ